MKKKIVLWLEDHQVETIRNLAASSNRSVSSAASALLANRSETDPVMVTLRQIQSQLKDLQLQVSGSSRPQPVVRHVPSHPAAAALQKKAEALVDLDDIPLP